MRDIERKRERKEGGFGLSCGLSCVVPWFLADVQEMDGWMDGWTKACRNRLCLPFQTQCDYFYVTVGKPSRLSVSDLSLNDV